MCQVFNEIEHVPQETIPSIFTILTHFLRRLETAGRVVFIAKHSAKASGSCSVFSIYYHLWRGIT